ncbi:MAG TPA: hypothetical protein VLZ74_05665 [Methylocella sp.]|nr:hypothetical protein [Methylocella sp.]
MVDCRLFDNIWILKFYRNERLLIKRSSSPTPKFQLYDDGTLERRLAGLEQRRGQNKPWTYDEIVLLTARDTAMCLNHTLEVIESYRPGLGQLLGQVAGELITEQLLEQGDDMARPPVERSHKSAGGRVEAPSVGPEQ